MRAVRSSTAMLLRLTLALTLVGAAAAACGGRSADIDYAGLDSMGYTVVPASGTPAVTREDAIASALAESPRQPARDTDISAVYVLLTSETKDCRDGERPVRCRDAPVWLVSIRGVEFRVSCGLHGESTPYDPERCPPNREWNVVIDADTGERLSAFSYR